MISAVIFGMCQTSMVPMLMQPVGSPAALLKGGLATSPVFCTDTSQMFFFAASVREMRDRAAPLCFWHDAYDEDNKHIARRSGISDAPHFEHVATIDSFLSGVLDKVKPQRIWETFDICTPPEATSAVRNLLDSSSEDEVIVEDRLNSSLIRSIALTQLDMDWDEVSRFALGQLSDDEAIDSKVELMAMAQAESESNAILQFRILHDRVEILLSELSKEEDQTVMLENNPNIDAEFSGPDEIASNEGNIYFTTDINKPFLDTRLAVGSCNSSESLPVILNNKHITWTAPSIGKPKVLKECEKLCNVSDYGMDAGEGELAMILVKQTSGQRLGIKVAAVGADGRSLLVGNVDEEGLVKSWNMENLQGQLVDKCRIVAVNGIKGDPVKMKECLVNDLILDIRFHKPVVCKYWLWGSCHFGNSCWNLHAVSALWRSCHTAFLSGHDGSDAQHIGCLASK